MFSPDPTDKKLKTDLVAAVKDLQQQSLSKSKLAYLVIYFLLILPASIIAISIVKDVRFPNQPVFLAIIIAGFMLASITFYAIAREFFSDPKLKAIREQIVQRRNQIQDPEQRRQFDAEIIGAELSQSSQQISQKKKLSPAQAFLTVGGALALAGLVILNLQENHTIHPFEVLAIFGMIGFPVALLLSYWTARAQPAGLIGARADGQPNSFWSIFLPVFPFTLMICALGFNMLNQWLDFSPPQTQTFPIISKYIFHGKSARNVVYIDTHIPQHFSFDHDRSSEVSIKYDEYLHVLPQQSSITLNIHPGLFGFPWYERRYQLDGLSVAEVKEAPKVKRNLPPSDVIADACRWAQNFNAGRDIEQIAPDDYHRDFWANGAARSVEPTVQGQNHGLGHYTFANGQLYGDIPWNHGRKHGSFTLYREDGSIDQQLSYKDGQAYGLNSWYNPDSSLKERWLLIGDGKFFPVSLCNSSSP